MKKLFSFSLLIILSFLIYIAQEGNPPKDLFSSSQEDIYTEGILKSEIKKVDIRNVYKINVELNTEEKLISAQEEITWFNKTEYPTNEIHFHLYPNAYKSNKTLFAKGYDINSPEAQTELQIGKLIVDGKPGDLIYFQPDILNPNDSTVAKVILNKIIQPGDSVKIYFEYRLKIPRSIKRMGYATGRNFFFVSQWFPKVGVFEEGKWVCSQYHPLLNFYSDFGNYSVKINVPKEYVVAATGVQKGKFSDDNTTAYYFEQYGVHDFAWLATDEILHRNDVYSRKDGSKILIQTYVQPEREKYFERYIAAVKNSLQFFEDNIGIYPYQNISLVDVPRTSASGGMEYPTLFTVSAELFSPKETGGPEYTVVHEFSHQFFQGLIANNEVYEAWLDEGMTSYIATKIMYKYYGEILEYFRFATYIPVYGLNFLSYNEIPIIYTLAEIKVPEGTRSAINYYQNLTVGSISDTSYKLPTPLSYVVNSYNKPELMLHSLERYIGFDKMMKIMREYYNTYKYKHPKGKDFFNIVQKNCKEDMNWFCNEFYYSAKVFDYSITSVKKISDNEYEVMAERLGDGIFKSDIVLYTNKDTLIQKWDDQEKWKIFKFNTNNEVIAAEIDPKRKNLLDINLANNSYTLEPRIWASLSLSIRWFFWVQNALMILGSIG